MNESIQLSVTTPKVVSPQEALLRVTEVMWEQQRLPAHTAQQIAQQESQQEQQ